jgi:hypothetical protein
MACINNVVNSLNLGKDLSILPLAGEALPADWAGPCDTIFLFASWRHNYTKESRYLGHGGMGVHIRVVAFNLVGNCVTEEAVL